jgi:hypothetical protein
MGAPAIRIWRDGLAHLSCLAPAILSRRLIFRNRERLLLRLLTEATSPSGGFPGAVTHVKEFGIALRPLSGLKLAPGLAPKT